MKRKYNLFVFLVFLSVLSSFLVFAGNTVTFEANVFAEPPLPPSVIGINVTEYIFIGNVSDGEQTDNVKVNVSNIGNVAITISPELVNASENIFSYLYFQRIQNEPYGRIGNWSMNISAPTSGGVRNTYFYVKLDLIDFNGTIDKDLIGHKANVRIIAVEQ